MINEQYRYMQDLKFEKRFELGLVSNSTWHKDPRRLAFALSRYKFVSKMIRGSQNVLEIGCGDGWNAKIVSTEVENLTLVDYDEIFVNDAIVNSRYWEKIPKCILHDFTQGSLKREYDAAYCLDVLEHIENDREDVFIQNIASSCKPNSIIIFGMPSLESQAHISEEKRDPGHVNCKNLYDMQRLMKKHFRVVLPFSMNDEVLHTGYEKMSQYIFSVCIN